MRHLCMVFSLACALFANAAAQTPTYVQPIKQLVPNGTLGTSVYSPAPSEVPFFKRLPDGERSTGSFMAPYSIHGKTGRFVSWFGVVRGIKVADEAKAEITLLMDQKAFDGMTDSHIMLVSYAGGGDFQATLQAGPTAIPPLSLVRVYGKVTSETGKVPQIAAEYIRIWPWMTFTFTDLGPADHSNPIWAKYSKFPAGGRIYKPYPNEDYYLRMIGDPKFFGMNWKEEH